MNSDIIILNLMSLLYVVVMIVGCFQVPEEAKTKTRHFIICLWVTLIGLALETAAAMLEGQTDKTGLLMACNFFPLWILDILTYYYSLYIRDLVADKTNKYKKFTSVLMGMSVVDFILVAVIFFSGHLFTIENGYFVEGSLMQLRMIIPGIILQKQARD